MRKAVVLGGGVAGITAALGLADRGYSVTLCEAHGWLGGRAFSFDDESQGRATDNGPHVALGCYDHFRSLLRRLGTEADFEAPRRLRLLYRFAGGRRIALQLSRLPVPLAMPAALATLPGLSVRERRRALAALVATARSAPADWDFERWLQAKRQHGMPRRLLWEPLCLAVMNAHPSQVSAQLFLGTLRQAFAGRAARAAIWIPRRPWSELLDQPARRALAAAGVEVLLRQRLTGVRVEAGRVGGLQFGDGSQRPVDDHTAVVSALPWHRLARVLPGQVAGSSPALRGRAIVNAAFDCGARDTPGAPPVEDGPLCALVDGAPFQFVYRRPGDPAGRFTLIGSAAPATGGAAALERQARAQLATFYPGFAVPEAARVRVTKEANATLLATPAAEALRPAPGRWHGLHNLWVCGDWTDTRLPSTLEGAAASAAGMLSHMPRPPS